MNRTILYITIGLFIASCGNDNSIKSMDGEVASLVSSNSKTPAELEAEKKAYEEAEAKRIAEETMNMTSLEFDRLKHDFGDVLSGSENTTQFIVRNTGDKPLIIEDVSASCGCTLPKKPEAPIAPGAEDVIEVTFKPKPGQLNEIKKTVTVTANIEDKVKMLEIRAFVKEG